jgi:AcrR family transcriptional regulator
LKQVFWSDVMSVQDSTKARLLRAAGEEFAEKGYELARIRTICDRAEANVAAVNYYFGDKEQLYVEAVVDAHRCGLPSVPTDADDHVSPAQALRGYIRQFLERVLAIDHPDDWRHRLMLREMLNPSNASEVLVRESIKPHFDRLKRILARICPEADDRRLSALGFSVIGQCLHYKVARRFAERLVGEEMFRELDLDYLTDHISGVCLAALGLAPPLNCAGESEHRLHE